MSDVIGFVKSVKIKHGKPPHEWEIEVTGFDKEESKEIIEWIKKTFNIQAFSS